MSKDNAHYRRGFMLLSASLVVHHQQTQHDASPNNKSRTRTHQIIPRTTKSHRHAMLLQQKLHISTLAPQQRPCVHSVRGLHARQHRPARLITTAQVSCAWNGLETVHSKV